MLLYKRTLNLDKLLKKKSFFLFGARSTGKSTLIKTTFPDVTLFDLLDADTYNRLLRRPAILSEVSAPLIVIDEIQKLPSLLDEVHRCIEKNKQRFLLTGSSARKLKRQGTNLLAGRAWTAHLFPLTRPEIDDFDLLQYLNRGGLPQIYPSDDFKEELKAYCNTYLKEEIVNEAATRNVEGFATILDLIGIQNGEELNFEEIASDTGVAASTVRNYIQVLEDTLLGFQLPAFRKTIKRKAISRSKFYLFDVGVARHLSGNENIAPKTTAFGKAFEHFIITEVRAYLSYSRSNQELTYWRSTSGMEVDFVIGDVLAVEVKSTKLVTNRHLKGLRALSEEQLVKKSCVVSLDPQKRSLEGVTIYPWEEFLDLLWSGKIC